MATCRQLLNNRSRRLGHAKVVLNHGFSWQAELEIHKREAARKSPEPRRRDGGTSASKAKGSSIAREAALEAELDITAQSLTAANQEAEALSTGLAKANGLIEVMVLHLHDK